MSISSGWSSRQGELHTCTRHEHGLTRIIRRRSLPRYIAIYNSPTQVRDRRVELTKVLQKFKFTKFRILILLQSSNFGLFPFLYGSKRSTKKIGEQMNFKGHFYDMVSSSIICLHSMLKSGLGTPNVFIISHYFI